MHDPGSIVPHIRPKVFTYNEKSRIKYNYYINNVSKDCDDSQVKQNNGRHHNTIGTVTRATHSLELLVEEF
jgi:putative aminopeptidase FrvX